MKKKLKRIIWLQSIYKEKILKNSKALSPAANLWQYNFLKNLQNQNIKILSIGHYAEPVWPKGNLLINIKKKNHVTDFESREINYINLPFFRNLVLFYRYMRILLFFSFKEGDLILIYNRSVVAYVSLLIRKIRSIPLVAIVADLEYPKKIDGYLFLSWKYLKKAKIKEPKFFLDGGINEFSYNKKMSIKKKIILYSGTIRGHAGLEFLISAFTKIKLNNIELWICGKGNDKNLRSLIDKEKRIKFFGYVPQSKLIKICSKADIFVNPRPIILNRYNFPSKLLFYLNFKKPIISTSCGLSPKYNDIIFFLKNEKIESLRKTIEEVLLIKKNDLMLLEKKIEKFNDINSWYLHTNRFINWINKNLF
jgi:hypothetical protein